MAKRFTAIDKWGDPWFCSLHERDKLFWIYLLDNCDSAGIWRANWMLVEVYFPGRDRNLDAMGDRVIKLDAEKWYIPKFVEFQYGDLSPDCKPHIPIIRILQKHGLWKKKGYLKGIQTLKDKTRQEQDKDKNKEEGVLGEKQESPKPLTDIQKVLTVYKIACGFDKDDKAWDKNFFPVNAKAAKQLLEFFGNWRDAADCVQDTVEKIRGWNSEATPSLIKIFSNHAAEWKKNKGEREAKSEVFSGQGR